MPIMTTMVRKKRLIESEGENAKPVTNDDGVFLGASNDEPRPEKIGFRDCLKPLLVDHGESQLNLVVNDRNEIDLVDYDATNIPEFQTTLSAISEMYSALGGTLFPQRLAQELDSTSHAVKAWINQSAAPYVTRRILALHFGKMLVDNLIGKHLAGVTIGQIHEYEQFTVAKQETLNQRFDDLVLEEISRDRLKRLHKPRPPKSLDRK